MIFNPEIVWGKSMRTKENLDKEWNLQKLKEEYESGNTKGLDNIVRPFFNEQESASEIIKMLNNLIEEYNNLFLSEEQFSKTLQFKDCLLEVFEVFIPFLDTYTRGIAYVNMCILSDDRVNKNFYNKYFKDCLKTANEYIENKLEKAYQEKDANIYFILGFLNFKAHEYAYAIHFLEGCRESMLACTLTSKEKMQLIECTIYLANSFEYTQRVPEAISQLIGVDEKQLKDSIISHQNEIKQLIMDTYEKISKNKCEIQDIEKICRLISQKSYYTLDVFSLMQDQLGIVKSYIHVLAHCISEYVSMSILAENTDYPYLSLLQMLSRFFMDWLVSEDDSYVTCQATIRAENDACPEAINLLLSQYEKKYRHQDDNQELSIKEQKAKAELEFYIFYFIEQELRYTYTRENIKKTFLEFGSKFRKYSETAMDGNPDYDSLFHYWVIQCKYLLKKYANQALQRRTDINYEEVDDAFLQLSRCRRYITNHVFVELISECQRLQELYVLFRQFRYLNRKDKLKCNLSEFQVLIQTDGTLKLEDEYEGILRKLYNRIEERNKILILAPVYESPSCSFSVRDINCLISFQQLDGINNNVTGNIDKAFRTISSDHNKPQVRKKKYISSINIDSNKIKWAFYCNYNSKNAFLYYKNFRKDGEEFSNELFPIMLNDSEKKTLKNLITEFNKNMSTCPCVDCDSHYNGRHDVTYNCNTKMFFYDSDDTKNISESLLNLLIFLEMDFLSANKELCISKDDKIVIQYIQNDEDGNQISIVILPKEYNVDSKEICEWCTFLDVDPSEIDPSEINAKRNKSDKVMSAITPNTNLCKFTYESLTDALMELEHRIVSSGEGTEKYGQYKDLKKLVEPCLKEDCKYQVYVDSEHEGQHICLVAHELWEEGIRLKVKKYE